MIKGWDDGVMQMSVGETAVLNIGADLVFEVELPKIN
jgi:FKBP-type peptidyl-prolyl cis-trans isomerase